MAKITIEADDIHDLLDTARVLLAAPGDARQVPGVAEEIDEPKESESPQPEAAPKRRGRPPKADGAETKSSSMSESQPSGTQAQTDAGGPSDLEAALLDGEPEVTAQDVMQAMHQHIEKHGAPATLPVLEQHGGGAKSFKQITPEFYPAVHAALKAGLV